jgi:hypothetical protein
MFEFSSKTKLNRRFSMRELAKLMQMDKSIREEAKNILSITLINALSNETMNFSSQGEVKEIYVFQIVLSEKIIPVQFITSLDKAINLHTLFLLQCGEESCYYLAYKERGEKGIRLSRYYSTEWSKTNTLQPLPIDISSLDEVYKAMLDRVVPIALRDNESVAGFIARYEQINKLKKDIDKKQKQVDCEKQSRRRFELNDELKALKAELERLS